MAPIGALHERLTDDELRTATLLGLATIPFTVVLSWESIAYSLDGVVLALGSTSSEATYLGSSVSGTPSFVAGLVAGYLYSDRPTESGRAGVRIGLVGSVPFLALLVVESIAAVWTASGTMAGILVLLTPIILVLAVGLYVLVAWLGARLGDWLATTVARELRALESRAEPDPDGGETRWWWVAGYVLAVPVVMGFVAGDAWLESDVVFLVTVVGMIALLILSVVALAALYVDATAHRTAGSAWRPTVWVYVGTPLAAYALVYLAATLHRPENPAGDGTYGFLVGLWVVAIAYLVSRHRTIGTP